MARAFFRRRKSCPFSGKNAPKIDYKDIRLLQGFMSERGKIVPSRITAVSAKKQRGGRAIVLIVGPAYHEGGHGNGRERRWRRVVHRLQQQAGGHAVHFHVFHNSSRYKPNWFFSWKTHFIFYAVIIMFSTFCDSITITFSAIIIFKFINSFLI